MNSAVKRHVEFTIWICLFFSAFNFLIRLTGILKCRAAPHNRPPRIIFVPSLRFQTSLSPCLCVLFLLGEGSALLLSSVKSDHLHVQSERNRQIVGGFHPNSLPSTERQFYARAEEIPRMLQIPRFPLFISFPRAFLGEFSGFWDKKISFIGRICYSNRSSFPSWDVVDFGVQDLEFPWYFFTKIRVCKNLKLISFSSAILYAIVCVEFTVCGCFRLLIDRISSPPFSCCSGLFMFWRWHFCCERRKR